MDCWKLNSVLGLCCGILESPQYTDYYVIGPTWESENLMRKYIWPNVHITVGAGVESGREGYRGDMEGSGETHLAWNHMGACFVEIRYVGCLSSVGNVRFGVGSDFSFPFLQP